MNPHPKLASFCCILRAVGRQPPPANPFSKPLNKSLRGIISGTCIAVKEQGSCEPVAEMEVHSRIPESE